MKEQTNFLLFGTIYDIGRVKYCLLHSLSFHTFGEKILIQTIDAKFLLKRLDSSSKKFETNIKLRIISEKSYRLHNSYITSYFSLFVFFLSCQAAARNGMRNGFPSLAQQSMQKYNKCGTYFYLVCLRRTKAMM